MITSSIFVPASQIIIRNFILDELDIIQAGYWQGIIRISDGYLMLITTSLSTYYLPKLSSLHDQNLIRDEIFSGYKLILPIIIFTSFTLYFFRDSIILMLFSKDFLKISTLFKFQLIGDFFKISSWLLAFLMTAKSMTRIFIITELIFSVTYVVFGIAFINFCGLIGITYAYALNYFIYLLVMVIIFRKLLFRKCNTVFCDRAPS
jgi:PST family polysaccharide transporter